MKIKSNTIDIIASISSLICAIHCAAVPIILSFSTLGSLQFLENPMIEWFFILLGVVFVFISLWPSYKKVHRISKPLVIAGIGFLLIAIGRFDLTELWEPVNTVTGAALVSVSHYFNWKIIKNRKQHPH
ncbi:MAG: MerC domain-containing protein [bacterium]